MPSSYVVMKEEEMTYVEGGGDVALSMKKSYLNKSTCINVASNYTKTTGLSKMRIAKEIYAHAVMYYSSPAALGGWRLYWQQLQEELLQEQFYHVCIG